jgi:hypothetical protein
MQTIALFQLAGYQHLRAPGEPLNAIANVGYTSGYAFGHAFKRHHGLARTATAPDANNCHNPRFGLPTT